MTLSAQSPDGEPSRIEFMPAELADFQTYAATPKQRRSSLQRSEQDWRLISVSLLSQPKSVNTFRTRNGKDSVNQRDHVTDP